MLDHDIQSYDLIAKVFDGASEGLTRDDILDNVTLYWLTNTAVSSARLYWEMRNGKGGLLRSARGAAADRRQRLPLRDLPGAGELGAHGLSAPRLLQERIDDGHAFRGLGTAAAADRGSARDLPLGAVI